MSSHHRFTFQVSTELNKTEHSNLISTNTFQVSTELNFTSQNTDSKFTAQITFEKARCKEYQID
jgi:hypothetical protein